MSKMSHDVEVSVLTPVYNVEKYLRQCLDSLATQDEPSVEFICLDDGSTDGCPSILQEYAQKDPRFRVVTKANSGYGATLNRGLDEARGRYIAIVESDDFATPSMIRHLLKAAVKHDADLVKCNFYRHWDGRDHRDSNFKGFPYGKVFDPADHPSIICTTPAIWTGLYRREMLERNSIRFRETPGAMFQDTAFTFKVWFAAESCVLLRRHLLHYRTDNPGSSSVQVSDKVFAVCDEVAEAEEFLRQRPDRCKRFLPWLLVDKWSKYRWVYRRLPHVSRVKLVQMMKDDYTARQAAGELDVALFNIGDAAALDSLLRDDPETFAHAYQEAF